MYIYTTGAIVIILIITINIVTIISLLTSPCARIYTYSYTYAYSPTSLKYTNICFHWRCGDADDENCQPTNISCDLRLLPSSLDRELIQIGNLVDPGSACLGFYSRLSWLILSYCYSANGWKTCTSGRTPEQVWLQSNLQGALWHLIFRMLTLHSFRQVVVQRKNHLHHGLQRLLATRRVSRSDVRKTTHTEFESSYLPNTLPYKFSIFVRFAACKCTPSGIGQHSCDRKLRGPLALQI